MSLRGAAMVVKPDELSSSSRFSHLFFWLLLSLSVSSKCAGPSTIGKVILHTFASSLPYGKGI
jgi:hypothetical protein